MSQPLSLDEAIKALRRDPTHPVRVKVDEALAVKLRPVDAAQPDKAAIRCAKSAAGKRERCRFLWGWKPDKRMKLRNVDIQNFRGIKALTLDVDDTTVLIGENNSGKTAVLEALRYCLREVRAAVHALSSVRKRKGPGG